MKKPKRPRIALGAAVAALVLTGATAATAGAAAPDPGSAPLGTVRGAEAPDTVDGEYIVVLKDSGSRARQLRAAEGVRDKAEELTDTFGGRPDRTFDSALKGFSLKATEKQARRLAADPAVAYVEANRVERGDDVQTDPSWGLDRIDQRDLPLDASYTYRGTASNVTAYVVDSGINISHEDFGGRASYGYNFVDGNRTAEDCHGHGTHVAGILGSGTYGVAKGVKLVAVKVLNCNNLGTTAALLAGYDWVAENAVKPAVVNVSIGGSPSDAKSAMIRKLVDAGLTITASAGNKGTDACAQSPALEESVITVAATARDDSKPSWSNHGSCVDVFAPGASVPSLGIDSDTAVRTMSGTSMSAPYATGVAALYVAENPGATPDQVSRALLTGATGDRVTGAGAGSPNLLLHSGE
ncbi:S8 family peptidase [Streptomyces sp. TRM 70361]|uniref:S8 family peptidase n=1 Tax=Streptomyces sp. TRM 70361 TaxID=3116553 RepID=UPI002E7BBB3B|nr:S8 family peptidase [Streptomyces sp. TRM 70361]MEE1938376.1 S8 family peptidase [Streptomyces sp. TRM 70361]